ncbi:SoxR reducing system RseC family protein [Fusibacter paucivorans]|uniref:SoxR reducing system RseC family protein n=1 Tax=Fusibacter paucivorans TaxID=76009 RepID=A0ABS5PRF3_9FIRM|nr:SoxR reducing system RseC family protein [Fusibacter paucivorans]MBS7527740.1 SoxR reducing system RseC family protein [Fusibacter paucivorans]
MMDRTGVIVSVDKEFSKIKLLRHTACGSCGACHLGDEQKDVMLVAKNDVHAEVGDMVEVSMGTSSVLSAAFIMYMIPLMSLFLGLVAGLGILNGIQYSGNVEMASAVIGLLFMAGAFLVIRLNDKRFLKSDKYTAHVEAIIQKSNDSLYPLA